MTTIKGLGGNPPRRSSFLGFPRLLEKLLVVWSFFFPFFLFRFLFFRVTALTRLGLYRPFRERQKELRARHPPLHPHPESPISGMGGCQPHE